MLASEYDAECIDVDALGFFVPFFKLGESVTHK
jgi:hypothetical protein